MNTYELEARPCANPKCAQVFKVLKTDTKSLFHSEFCRELHEKKSDFKSKFSPSDRRLEQFKKQKEELCQNMETSVVTVEYGTAAGERRSKSLLENLRPRVRNQVENIALKIMREKELPDYPIQSEGKESGSIVESTITPTKRPEIKSAMNGESTTKNVNFKPKETIMQETEKTKNERSLKTDSEETHSSVSNHLSMALEEERSGSIQYLNTAGKHLLDLAEGLVAPTRRDEDGEAVQRAPSQNIDMGIKALSEFRNMMKTKLDFMKFGKELSDKAGK